MSTGAVQERKTVMLERGPLRAFLLSMVETERRRGGLRSPYLRVANRLGWSIQTVRDVLTTEGVIEQRIVNEGLGRVGETIAGVYDPARWSREDRQTVSFPDMSVRRCGSLGCPEPRTDGSLMCVEHAAVFAEFRTELEAHGRALHENGMARRDPRSKSAKAKRRGRPTCCNPACFHERYGTERYCPSCQDAGFVEGADD